MKNKFALVTISVLSALLLAGCGNNNNAAKSSSSSNKAAKVSHKSSGKVSNSSHPTKNESQRMDSESSSSSSDNNGVHLTGGQSTIDYLIKVKGDKGWTIEGGTYGGAHGAPTSPDYVPYNVVKSADGSECYYVYQNGKIVEQEDMEENGDQVNSNADSQADNVNNDED